MNNLTFMQKIKNFIKNHKILSLVILLILIVVVYFVFFKKNKVETRYVTSTVAKSTIISSVSGSGQIESSDTLNINAKTSGEVTSVAVKVGQTVSKGQLIASIDSRDAKIALENAQLSLSKLKTPDSLTVLQKENSLDKAYNDGWNNISSFVVDTDSIVVGLGDLHNDYLGSKNRMLLSKSGKSKIELSENAYWAAKASLDKTTQLYKSLTRSSSDKEIEDLVNKVYETSKEISNAVKLAQASFDYTVSYLDQSTTTESTSTQKDLTSWTSSINTYVNSIASNLNNIKEYKQSLSDTLAGSDDLDIRQAELNVETKQNSYNDCFIRAPFDGVIASLTAKVGQTASGSIGTLISKQNIVKISLNEVDIAKIKLGQKATLTFDAVDGLSITGLVEGIDSVGTVSSGVVSYNVSISLDTDDARVKPGMSVSAVIITDTASNVLTVPNSAVKTKNGSSYVETFDSALSESTNGNSGSISSVAPKKTIVKIGLSDDKNTQIISGLKEGDIIVTKTITSSTNTTSTATSSSTTKKSTNSTKGILGGAMVGGGPRD